MFNEVRAEISKLVHDVVFVRNLSVILLAAMVISCGLAELQSQRYTAVQPGGCRLRFAKAKRKERLTVPALTAFRGQNSSLGVGRSDR